MSQDISDLIYVNYYEAKTDLEKAFPEAKITDASDFVHSNRLEIRTPCENDVEYYSKLAKLCLLSLSLKFRFLAPEDMKSVIQEILELKKKGDAS